MIQMNKVPLTKGLYSLVDLEDFERVSQFSWCAKSKPGNLIHYAHRGLKLESGKWTTQMLHRFILNARPDQLVDHINHDTLDNRKANLRIVTCRENSLNRKGLNSNSTTGVNNVSICGTKFRARIGRKSLGLYKNVVEAAKAIKKYKKEK